MASFSPACQCFSTLLLLLLVAASPLQTHARESRFFSKVSRAQPETTSPKAENTKTDSISPSSSPSTATEPKTEHGYGLFGKEETYGYEYSPTTTNPTKSETRKFKYVEPNGVKEANAGYRYGAGEKQGMSDTRFLENGKYYYDIRSGKEVVANDGKLTEDDDGHESYYGHGYGNSGNQFKEERYETGEKQGLSDTRSLENGRYFYHLGEEERKKNNDGYENNVEFYKPNNYGNEEEEEEEDKYKTPAYRTGERQGMSDTRFLHNGRYFYGINSEDPNGVESYDKAKKNDEYYEKESYSNFEKEDEMSDFRSTPNKFPRYEFDSMEEYDKYEQGRSHQKEYAP